MIGSQARVGVFLAGLSAAIVMAGCRRDGRVTSKGTVTYAGTPVERGVIGFFDDSTGHSYGTVIENGNFTIHSLPGSYRVQIRGARRLPPNKQPPPPAETAYEDFLPEAFNARSTLIVEVQPSGANRFTFDLTPQLPKK